MQKINKLSVKLAALFFMLVFVMASVPTQAAVNDSLCKGGDKIKIGVDAPSDACEKLQTRPGTNKINNVIETVINIFSTLVGIIAVIMIIYAGFKYITSGGSSERVGSAKNTLIYAIVGLVLVALAQIIVRFVLGTATGA